MRAVDIIIKKRDKNELTSQEIEFFVRGFTKGDIPDYQAASFAMAVLLNGMTPFETADLTLAMARSGQLRDSALIMASAISCAQWLVASVTGAGGNGHTTVPWRAFTVTGRNVPSFFGVRGSRRYARAMCTAEIVLGYEEFTNPIT